MKLSPLIQMPLKEITLEKKVSEYLQVNKIGNDIVSIRKIIHDQSMPFTNSELEQYKRIRETHFKQFKNKLK